MYVDPHLLSLGLNFSKDGSIATAIFQTSCRIGYAIGLALATLIQVTVESKAIRSGASDRDALAKGLSAAFWFCGACAASGEYLRLDFLLS